MNELIEVTNLNGPCELNAVIESNEMNELNDVNQQDQFTDLSLNQMDELNEANEVKEVIGLNALYECECAE